MSVPIIAPIIPGRFITHLVVADQDLTLALSPGATSGPRIRRGTDLICTGKVRAGWAEVSSGAQTGWVQESSLTPVGATATADTGSVTVKTSTRMLAQPTASATTLVTLSPDQPLERTGMVRDEWVQVNQGSTTGWVRDEQLMFAPRFESTSLGPAITTARVSLLAAPFTTSKPVGTAPKDASVHRTGKIYGTWSEITHSGTTGWVQNSLLAFTAAISTDEALAGVLRLSAGDGLRPQPSASATALRHLAPGTLVLATGRVSSTFAEVKDETGAGWVSRLVLRVVDVQVDPQGTGQAQLSSFQSFKGHPHTAAQSLGSARVGTVVTRTGRCLGSHREVTYGKITGWVPATGLTVVNHTIRNLAVSSPLAPDMAGVITTMDEHVVRRFSLAAEPRIYEQARTIGYREWMTRQLAMTDADERDWLDKLESELPLALKRTHDAGLRFREIKGEGWGGVAKNAGSEQRQSTTTLRALFSPRMLNETFSQFWLDHFSLPYAQEKFASYTIDLEMRRWALTSFAEVFTFVMGELPIYKFLDNDSNVADKINENLGREVLELYSVGVGNHTEEDVRQASILLSGWSHTWDGLDNLTLHWSHQFTDKPLVILGKTYPNATMDQAKASHAAFVQNLAHHPATARRIATKLAVRFVREDPPKALVDRLTSVYLATGGDVKKLIWSIIDSPEFPASAGTRWKRPGEYIDGLHRARQVTWNPEDGNMWDRVLHRAVPKYLSYLDLAGHRPRTWIAPDGLPDKDSYWTGSSAILQCVNAASMTGPLDPELTQSKTWAQILKVAETMNRTDAAVTICRSLTGYQPNALLLSRIKAPLDGAGSWDERVNLAVTITMTSPLGFLR